ncbi:MAG: hypothetical protein SV760_03990 [Halobacteria archaeon]|nr:hypothetical protein [Halobacteria archaeon]
MREGPPYALRVPLEETEEAIERAESVGVYDDTRSVRNSGNVNEVPVEVPEPFGGMYGTVVQDDPVPRKVTLDDRLDGVSAPTWRVVGEVALVEFDDETDRETKKEVADALLEHQSGVETVLDYRGVGGTEREPDVSYVAGDEETETVHRENGFAFELDPSEVMFSVGNARERVRMRDVVDESERVLDMFAGIGYFSVPLAVGGADVVAVEINPTAYGYLDSNVERNGVGRILQHRLLRTRNRRTRRPRRYGTFRFARLRRGRPRTVGTRRVPTRPRCCPRNRG